MRKPAMTPSNGARRFRARRTKKRRNPKERMQRPSNAGIVREWISGGLRAKVLQAQEAMAASSLRRTRETRSNRRGGGSSLPCTLNASTPAATQGVSVSSME